MVRLVTIIITVLSGHCCELPSAESYFMFALANCASNILSLSHVQIIIIVMYNCPSAKGKLRINKQLHQGVLLIMGSCRFIFVYSHLVSFNTAKFFGREDV